MRTKADIIQIDLSEEEFILAQYYSRSATIGGVSRIRSKPERQATCSLDNLFGQIGNLALSLYLYNSVDPYVQSRKAADNNPRQGDGGYDLPGLPIDIKTSKVKNAEDCLCQNLLVREPERHPNHIYILALSDYYPTPKPPKPPTIYLIGWAATQHLPTCGTNDIRFKTDNDNREPVYRIEGYDLRRLPPKGNALNFFLSQLTQ